MDSDRTVAPLHLLKLMIQFQRAEHSAD
jgi:hypothetical protein